MIVVATDKYNMAPPHGLLPLTLFLVLLGIGVALGMQTCKYCVYQRLPCAIISETINFFSVCSQSRPWFRRTPAPVFRGVRKGGIYLQKVIVSFTFYSYPPRAWWNLFLSQYWLWCPIIAPILGAQVGVGFYDLFLKKRDSEDSSASLWVSPLCLHFFRMVYWQVSSEPSSPV